MGKGKSKRNKKRERYSRKSDSIGNNAKVTKVNETGTITENGTDDYMLLFSERKDRLLIVLTIIAGILVLTKVFFSIATDLVTDVYIHQNGNNYIPYYEPVQVIGIIIFT